MDGKPGDGLTRQPTAITTDLELTTTSVSGSSRITMTNILHTIFLIAILLVVLLLAATAIPSLRGEPLGGPVLLIHMMASGALVMALPLYAILFVWRHLDPIASAAMQRTGFWLVLLTGLVTTGTVFACMLPIASTDTMHKLIVWHGYAGFAMVPAVALLIWGVSRTRRIKSIRSAIPG